MKENNDTITLCTNKDDTGQINCIPVSTMPLVKDIKLVAKDERRERNLPLTDTLFISIAWVLRPAFRFFLLCPEVIWCDVTSHSNNKGFHLLTFSCQTSVDRQVIFLWIWIPNQRRFTFRWVFQHAIPQLIPQAHRNRVKFIMKDGNPQQRNEIIGALREVFPRAEEGGCGYHIVTIRWGEHVPGVSLISKRGQDAWKKVVNHIQGYVDSDEEYHISKYLLLCFIASAPVLEAAEGNIVMIVRIMKFLNGNVFVYESLYLHYKRKHLMYFSTADSSAHKVDFFVVLSPQCPLDATSYTHNLC
ncbi:hypothetical protein ACHAWF_010307 [Thalassiosira exigua]